MPWIISLSAHLALTGTAVFVVWSVQEALSDDEVVIPLVSLSETPGAPLDVQVQQRVETTTATAAPTPAPAPTPLEADLELDLALPGLGEPVFDAPTFELNLDDAAQFDTNFYGNGGNAKNIVYVVDASGSLVDIFPYVRGELQNSISKLSPKQKFTVIFFTGGDTPGEDSKVVEVQPRGMKTATADMKLKIKKWIGNSKNLSARSSGNPVDAITKAFSYRPDLIYLLSDNITGRRQYEIDQEDLVAQIKQMNRGAIKINTIQFVYPDQLEKSKGIGTLELIAQETGGKYKFVPESELK